MNYSKEELQRIFVLYSNIGLASKQPFLFPELNDISKILNIIFHRTAFFTSYIDDETSYKTISYIIDLFKSIDKEELKLIDHHLIDSFTYPYNSFIDIFINRLNSIFRPKEVNDDAVYVTNFSKVFTHLNAVYAACVDISRYNNLDILVKTFNNYMIGTSQKREYYALLQLVVAYIYKNIDNYNEEMILNIFDSLLKDDYYLSKIRLNSAFRFDEIIDDNILRWHNKEDLNYTYNYIADIINKIIGNEELCKAKRVIK